MFLDIKRLSCTTCKMKNDLALARNDSSDVLYFDDGDNVKRKSGKITNIEGGFVYFSERGHEQLIPIFRIIRIVKGES